MRMEEAGVCMTSASASATKMTLEQAMEPNDVSVVRVSSGGLEADALSNHV